MKFKNKKRNIFSSIFIAGILTASSMISLNTQNTALNNNYQDETISSYDDQSFIKKYKNIIAENNSLSNQVTDLDYLLNPFLNLSIENQLNLFEYYKNGKKTSREMIFNFFLDKTNSSEKYVEDFNVFAKEITNKINWAKNNKTFNKKYHINSNDFARVIQNDINSNSLKVDFSVLQRMKKIGAVLDMRQRYNHEWRNKAWIFDQGPKLNTIDFSGFEWNFQNNQQNFENSFTKSRIEDYKQSAKLSKHNYRLNSVNTFQNSIQSYEFYGKDNKLIDVTEKRYKIFNSLIKMGIPGNTKYSFYDYKVLDMHKNNDFWNSWTPTYNSSLRTDQVSGDTHDLSVQTINAAILANYMIDKNIEDYSNYNLLSIYNSIEFKNYLFNLYESDIWNKVGHLGYRHPYIYDKNQVDSLMVEKISDINKYYKQIPQFKKIQQIEEVNYNNVDDSKQKTYHPNSVGSGKFELQYLSNLKLFNSNKINIDLKNIDLQIPRIESFNYSSLFKLKKSNNNIVNLGYNTDLLMAFENLSYLIQHYKNMHDNLILNKAFDNNAKLMSLFNNNYISYISLFNNYLVNSLKGKYSISEMKNIELFFQSLKK